MSTEILREYHYPQLTYYGRVETSLTPAIFDTLTQRLTTHAYPTLLDLGCSCGFTTQDLKLIFAPQGIVVGIDINIRSALRQKNMYQTMQNNHYRPEARNQSVSLLYGDGFDPPFAADTFEAVFVLNNFMINILEKFGHINPIINLILGLKRVAKPQGSIVFGYGNTKDIAAILITLDKNKNVSSIIGQHLLSETYSTKRFNELLISLQQSFQKD